ncbi:MAG: hypothetical protein KGL13_02360 [Gammaproteobacteria bacterium]|nr:hypothetical protein [Gammaproteobacteria bacterium]
MHRFPRQGRNPVVRIVLMILLGLAAVVAVGFGVVILVILLAAAVVFFSLLYLRARWMRHKFRLHSHPADADTHAHGVTLEGEYTVNKNDDDERS